MDQRNSSFLGAGGLPCALKIGLLASMLLMLSPLLANDKLFFWEAQMVGGYDLEAGQAILYSHHPHHAMQKPSIGFDYIQRLGSENRDWGLIALQYRVAYQETQEPRFASQLYNAYLKLNARPLDLWIGSNKPALGLNQNLDNHAALLPDMSSRVFTYDRDWGIGAARDYRFWQPSLSLSNGSGMRLYNKEGNYLLAGRLGLGNFNAANYNLGFSAAHGKVLEAMGYTLGHPNSSTGEYILHDMNYLGMDANLRYLNYELKADLLAGRFYRKEAYAALLRAGYNLLPEDGLKLEAQVLHSRQVDNELTDYSAAAALRLNPDLMLRAMSVYQAQKKEWKLVAQLYFYKPFSQ